MDGDIPRLTAQALKPNVTDYVTLPACAGRAEAQDRASLHPAPRNDAEINVT